MNPKIKKCTEYDKLSQKKILKKNLYVSLLNDKHDCKKLF